MAVLEFYAGIDGGGDAAGRPGTGMHMSHTGVVIQPIHSLPSCQEQEHLYLGVLIYWYFSVHINHSALSVHPIVTG